LILWWLAGTKRARPESFAISRSPRYRAAKMDRLSENDLPGQSRCDGVGVGFGWADSPDPQKLLKPVIAVRAPDGSTGFKKIVATPRPRREVVPILDKSCAKSWGGLGLAPQPADFCCGFGGLHRANPPYTSL
jgi:hypothetical protein